jgi:3-oxoacyl-[acyl-carrier protein] reductase
VFGRVTELVVVTGASRGIGLAIARRFRDRGAAVWNLSRTPSPDDDIVDFAIDFARPEVVESIPETLLTAVAAGIRVILIHNASATANDTVDSVEDGVLQRMLQVGVQAPADLNRLLLPLMSPGSAVIYLGSTLSEKAVPGSFSYVVAKHAVVGMMRATSSDLLGRGIHSACVCPGVTDTESLREQAGDLDGLRETTGAARLIDPDEIAAVVEWAADSPVLNGAVLHANHGQRQR